MRNCIAIPRTVGCVVLLRPLRKVARCGQPTHAADSYKENPVAAY